MKKKKQVKKIKTKARALPQFPSLNLLSKAKKKIFENFIRFCIWRRWRIRGRWKTARGLRGCLCSRLDSASNLGHSLCHEGAGKLFMFSLTFPQLPAAAGDGWFWFWFGFGFGFWIFPCCCGLPGRMSNVNKFPLGAGLEKSDID